MVGMTLLHYRIIKPLGKGGMGEVYLAEDTSLNREVAIKVLPEFLRNDPDRLARFRREAAAAAKLNHPNIAHIYALEEAAPVRDDDGGEKRPDVETRRGASLHPTHAVASYSCRRYGPGDGADTGGRYWAGTGGWC